MNDLQTLNLPGLVVGDVIGSGGFGAVYAAHHTGLDIDVAIKLMEPEELDPTALDKAFHEARLMARLDHPNLLRVFHAGRTERGVYLVLELMDGGSLDGVIALPAPLALGVTQQLLSGIQALHDANIIHRDIKPANCLRRSNDNRFKLADLGLATKLRGAQRETEFAGTVAFMAPELFSGPAYSEASDIYALGMTLASLLLRESPFKSRQ